MSFVLFGSFILFRFFLFYGTVSEHSHGGRISVIKLSIIQTPQKGNQKADGYEKTNADQCDDDVHFVINSILLKCVLAARLTANDENTTTLTLLNGINIAATNGVRWPAIANDSATAL